MDKLLAVRIAKALEEIATELKRLNDDGLVVLEDFGINEN